MSTTVNREVWYPAIEENFYSDWTKLTSIAKDDSIYVDSKSVHIPNAGSVGTLLKNNTSYPVSVEERTDTINSYDVDSYQMPPIRIGAFDTKDLSYNKQVSVVKDQVGNIGETIKFNSYTSWYIGKVTGKHVETEGQIGTTTGNTATSEAPSSTTTVYTLGVSDVRKAKAILDKQKVPQTGRILLLPISMFNQLHESVIEKFDIEDNDGWSMFNKPFYGFKVVQEVQVVNTTSTGTLRAYGHVGATTDLQVGLAYQVDQVSISRKEVKIYSEEDSVTYMADLVSAESWAGSKYRRYDKFGVVPIIQKAA